MAIGAAIAILAMSENLVEARVLLIAIANSVDRKFVSNVTSFVGILSVPGAFLVFGDFRNRFTSLEVSCHDVRKVLLELK